MDPPPGLDLALPPFSLLDAAGRARLLDSLDMGFHPAGEILMSAGQPSAHVYVLLKGQARAYDLDQDGREQPFADYGPGEVFGAWAAITGSASYHFRASTVCLSFLIPTPVFRSLVADQPAFAAYFSERLSVRGQLAEPSRPEQAELMLAQAGDAQLAPVERVPAGASITAARAWPSLSVEDGFTLTKTSSMAASSQSWAAQISPTASSRCSSRSEKGAFSSGATTP